MTTPFCTECGQPVATGSAFCEGCGTPVAPKAPPPALAPDQRLALHAALVTPGVARHPDSAAFAKAATRRGLLVTNTAVLAQRTPGSPAAGISLLLAHALRHGVFWHVLDLARCQVGSWEAAVQAATTAKERIAAQGSPVEGVLLLGDAEAVPTALVANRSDNIDADIDSDLPWSNGCTTDHWEDADALQPVCLTGRLPIGPGFDWDACERYLANLDEAWSGADASGDVCGITTKVWHGASAEVHRSLGEGPLLIAPPIATSSQAATAWLRDAPCYYVNLHGSDEACPWFGDDGRSHPAVIEPRLLAGLQRVNVVGVEACYGARYRDLPQGESSLLTALATRTIAFAASSRVAFGPPRPPIGLADIMIQRVLAGMRAGHCAGVALRDGKRALLDGDLSPHLIKTVLEFELYGDPFACLGTSPGRWAGLPVAAKAPGAAKAGEPRRRIVMPDTLGRVRTAVDEARKRIRERLDRYIAEQYPSLAGVAPSGFDWQTNDGKTLHSFIYAQRRGPVLDAVILDATDDGSIRHECVAR
jgi:hypothetical protein